MWAGSYSRRAAVPPPNRSSKHERRERLLGRASRRVMLWRGLPTMPPGSTEGLQSAAMEHREALEPGKVVADFKTHGRVYRSGFARLVQ